MWRENSIALRRGQEKLPEFLYPLPRLLSMHRWVIITYPGGGNTLKENEIWRLGHPENRTKPHELSELISWPQTLQLTDLERVKPSPHSIQKETSH